MQFSQNQQNQQQSISTIPSSLFGSSGDRVDRNENGASESVSQAPAALSAHAFGGGGSGGDLQEGSAANIVGMGSSLFEDS